MADLMQAAALLGAGVAMIGGIGAGVGQGFATGKYLCVSIYEERSPHQ